MNDIKVCLQIIDSVFFKICTKSVAILLVIHVNGSEKHLQRIMTAHRIYNPDSLEIHGGFAY